MKSVTCRMKIARACAPERFRTFRNSAVYGFMAERRYLAGWLADYSINTAHRRKYLVSRYVYSIATNYRGAGEVSG